MAACFLCKQVCNNDLIHSRCKFHYDCIVKHVSDTMYDQTYGELSDVLTTYQVKCPSCSQELETLNCNEKRYTMSALYSSLLDTNLMQQWLKYVDEKQFATSSSSVEKRKLIFNPSDDHLLNTGGVQEQKGDFEKDSILSSCAAKFKVEHPASAAEMNSARRVAFRILVETLLESTH